MSNQRLWSLPLSLVGLVEIDGLLATNIILIVGILWVGFDIWRWHQGSGVFIAIAHRRLVSIELVNVLLNHVGGLLRCSIFEVSVKVSIVQLGIFLRVYAAKYLLLYLLLILTLLQLLALQLLQLQQLLLLLVHLGLLRNPDHLRHISLPVKTIGVSGHHRRNWPGSIGVLVPNDFGLFQHVLVLLLLLEIVWHWENSLVIPHVLVVEFISFDLVQLF